MANPNSSHHQLQLYRRPLPDTCISFTSELGKKLFCESLSSGHMNCYFKLAAQFSTQDDTAYCGPTSLVVVLNALAVDPNKLWKSPWRWYDERTLECDSGTPLRFVQRHGMTLDQLASMARLNGLNETVTHLREVVSLDAVRTLVREYCTRDDAFLVFNFSRTVLHQTGGGHISPMGGYHPGRDLVLILDVARFKYPPYWTPLPLVFEAMKKVDHVSGKPRGFIELSRLEDPPLVLFKLAAGLRVTPGSPQLQTVTSFVQRWQAWLLAHYENWTRSPTSSPAILYEGCLEFIQALLSLDDDVPLLTTQSHDECPTDKTLCQESFHLSLIIQIEKLPVYNTVKSIFTRIARKQKDKLKRIFPVARGHCELNCVIYNQLDSEHFVTFLLACWPHPCANGVYSDRLTLNKFMFADLTNDVIQTELITVSKHLYVVFRDRMCK
ncbi:glutathione gamma-glutamylcysteinyltransferase-like [Gigantopelta aegis]|uniref:glutathione gamma-glutamylcysteinyltransferase-like n=1 Tax=Gigantopelta aegis TaxID=1735272 RepID=UPI001B88D9B7|nr:glutathione gamma-glutamylcysteinyltransferase-like [Gigantopelta aegis]XP_041371331.1 glutathione gamma-glutamylcysteinyltransferase-like [Gigantopelta aegis]XP_041371332.1 glutathione gamma-glutamylcysteinyltransferase-like [Gigantopelta aegis]XP_041371333.1 glutathione gamma-glutamylcysteinyltransferase-like [Gigantopelta aegis]